MPALIIALVVLVLVAIGTVVRLLIAEMAKPTGGQAKTIRKPAPGAVAAGVAVGASTASAATMAPARAPAGAPRSASSGAVALAPARVAPAPARVAPAGRVKKARMRDVVERGDGVRVGPWRRIRSALSLLVLVLVIGAGVAAVVGGFVVLIAFALEQAVN